MSVNPKIRTERVGDFLFGRKMTAAFVRFGFNKRLCSRYISENPAQPTKAEDAEEV